MNSISKFLWCVFFHIMFWGNMLWLFILYGIGSILGVPWTDVEAVLRPFGARSINETLENNNLAPKIKEDDYKEKKEYSGASRKAPYKNSSPSTKQIIDWNNSNSNKIIDWNKQ